MNRRKRTHTLKEIARVREVQQLAAEMAVASANAELERLARQRDADQERLRADHSGWAASVQRVPFAPTISSGWASAVLEREGELRNTEVAIRGAMQRREQCIGAWRGTLARSEVAQSLARRAQMAERQAGEEAKLNASADRFSQMAQRA